MFESETRSVGERGVERRRERGSSNSRKGEIGIFEGVDWVEEGGGGVR